MFCMSMAKNKRRKTPEQATGEPTGITRSWTVSAATPAGINRPAKQDATEGLELFASAPADESGYDAWQSEREATRRAFEKRWGVPLNKRVRVQLRGEPREREGLLRLVEELDGSRKKSLRLRLGDFLFNASQIESLSRV